MRDDRGHHRADPVGAEPVARARRSPNSSPRSAVRVIRNAFTAPARASAQLPVVGDQEVGAGAHQLPADEQHPQVVGGHDGDHRAGEQRRPARRTTGSAGRPRGSRGSRPAPGTRPSWRAAASRRPAGRRTTRARSAGPTAAAGGEHVRRAASASAEPCANASTQASASAERRTADGDALAGRVGPVPDEQHDRRRSTNGTSEHREPAAPLIRRPTSSAASSRSASARSSSTSMCPWVRNTSSTMASASPISAAAITMTNSAKVWPPCSTSRS